MRTNLDGDIISASQIYGGSIIVEVSEEKMNIGVINFHIFEVKGSLQGARTCCID